MAEKTKKLALTAVLTAAALIVFIIEAQIPAPVPIPGIKLGLANIIVLTAMLLLGRKTAGVVQLLRIIMGAVFVGPATLLYSAAGGLLAYGVMCALVGVIPEKRLWVLSALAAVAHNAGQLAACVLVVKTPGVFAYLPVLAVSGIITGIFTGFAAMYLVRALRKMNV
ncbi:MAG: Gx transporter family protein [Candidatus Limivicinus sp.]|jgi:heptaprenyl diphosphate synthase